MQDHLDEKLDFILNRSSVRHYTSEKISTKIMDKLFSAALQTPTSSHIQAFSILNITDLDLRLKLSVLSGHQTWIVDASHFLIFCADLHKIAAFSHFDIRSQEVSQDAYLASLIDGSLVGMTVSLAAEALNIGSVMIGALRNDLDAVAELLNLPIGVIPIFGLCLGYYKERKKPKPRLAKSLFIHENKYELSNESKKLLDQYQIELTNYYKESILEHQGLRSRFDLTWLEAVTGAIINKKRYNMGTSLQKRGFDLSVQRIKLDGSK